MGRMSRRKKPMFASARTGLLQTRSQIARDGAPHGAAPAGDVPFGMLGLPLGEGALGIAQAHGGAARLEREIDLVLPALGRLGEKADREQDEHRPDLCGAESGTLRHLDAGARQAKLIGLGALCKRPGEVRISLSGSHRHDEPDVGSFDGTYHPVILFLIGRRSR